MLVHNVHEENGSIHKKKKKKKETVSFLDRWSRVVPGSVWVRLKHTQGSLVRVLWSSFVVAPFSFPNHDLPLFSFGCFLPLISAYLTSEQGRRWCNWDRAAWAGGSRGSRWGIRSMTGRAGPVGVSLRGAVWCGVYWGFQGVEASRGP